MAAASPITIGDNQNVDVALKFVDAAGVPTTDIDSGSVTAVFADGSEFVVTVSADETSVNVASNGTVESGDVLTINATVNGVPLPDPGTIEINVEAGPATSVVLTPGTPNTNAPAEQSTPTS